MFKKIFNSLFIDKTLKEDISFLREISLFEGLSDKALVKIALIVFKKDYLAGETIFEQNREAEVIYIVRDGLIRLNNDSAEKIMETGSIFGEISLISGKKHDSYAKAVKNSSIYLIYRGRFNDIVNSDPKSGVIIMKNLIKELMLKIKSLEI